MGRLCGKCGKWTRFVRNHNRITARLQKRHPHWTGEQLYHEARERNSAAYQSIVYNAWIPAVLGNNALRRFHRLRRAPNEPAGGAERGCWRVSSDEIRRKLKG